MVSDFDPKGYFALPDSSKLDHCPKCGDPLEDTGVRITRPDGQVRKVVECYGRIDPDWHLESAHYDGSLPL